MIVAVMSAVEPPNLPRRPCGDQGVEHREHRSRPYAGAQQNHRFLARPQRETSSRRAYIENVANLNVIVQERAGYTLNLALDAYPVRTRAGFARHGIVPQDGWRFRLDPQSQNQELARERDGQR